MNKLICLFFCICLPLLAAQQIQAQSCSSNFTINTEVKNSTCQSNGEITVTLSGDTANIFNVQYGLSSTSGFVINPQPDSILRNIPPGTYELTVRAFCSIDENFDVVKSISNIVVGGNYKVPQVSFNASSSRKSYENCNTGIIVLNVTDGSGSFTFRITSAPTGVTPSVVYPTKNGNVYTLPGDNYPAGDYTIQVSDECYTAVKGFTLEAISGIPAFTTENYSSFRPDLDNTQGSCSFVRWTAASTQINTNSDYKRYFNDGMYEIGAAPAGQMPTNWTTWNSTSTGGTLLNISPKTIPDFFNANSIQIYTRVKGCETSYRSFTTFIKQPSFTGYNSYSGCDYYIRYLYPWTDFDGMVCYPLTISVKSYNTGETVYYEDSWMYSVNRNDPITLQYDTLYTAIMRDQNGFEKSYGIRLNNTRSFYIGGNVLDCDSYKFYFYTSVSGKPASCWEWPVKVTITDPYGNIVQYEQLENSTSVYTPPLMYGILYTITVEYPDGTKSIYTRNVASTLPTSYTLYTNSSYDSKCIVNYGRLSISSSKAWPSGTTFTVTGPPGYNSQTVTTTTSATSYTMPSSSNLPPGTYTLTADHHCGDPVTAIFNNPGIYDYKGLGYDSLNTCSGMKILPKGTITYKGVDIASYYRLISGPSGFETHVVSPGGSFILSAPGTYILGITSENSVSACALGTDTIVYTAPPLDLDPYASTAYVCVGETMGNISVKAINGVAPYTYELWDKTNTVKQNVADITTASTAHFTYGLDDETYTVRISDQCGSSFSQQITLTELSDARIVYSPESSVCYGSTIRLRCITLGQTAYNWTGPNGFTSTEQNPTIDDANETMAGWYRVSVTPEFCDIAVEDSVYIRVYPLLTAGDTEGDQEICVRTRPSVISSQTSGGKGSYVYQWQSRDNGVSEWDDIQDATDATYQSPAQTVSGIKYFRRKTTDDCGVVYSDSITVNTKACYIPVNPAINSKVGKN